MGNPEILEYFKYEHLPPHLQEINKPFADLAKNMCEILRVGEERSVMFRKLLEAKDCAVRSAL